MSRESLYSSYINEIKFFNPNIRNIDADQIIKNYKEVSCFSDLFWFDLYYGPEVVGFILVTNGVHCPQCADYHIMEMYLKPQYRGKGIASKALDKLFSNNPGKVMFFTLETNVDANKFWGAYYSKHKENINKLKTENAPGCISHLWEIGKAA